MLGWIISIVSGFFLKNRARAEREAAEREAVERKAAEARITDPVPCPHCGYGKVSATKGGFCLDCLQTTDPTLVEPATVKVMDCHHCGARDIEATLDGDYYYCPKCREGIRTVRGSGFYINAGHPDYEQWVRDRFEGLV